MARPPQDITDAELAIMQVLWERGPCTIRQLTDLLYPEGRPAQYATVQKLLERLEDKESVTRDRKPAVHVFSARLGREELVGRRLQAVAEKLCGGSWTPLLTHLVQNQRLTTQEREQLRTLIDELAPEKAKKRGK